MTTFVLFGRRNVAGRALFESSSMIATLGRREALRVSGESVSSTWLTKTAIGVVGVTSLGASDERSAVITPEGEVCNFAGFWSAAPASRWPGSSEA